MNYDFFGFMGVCCSIFLLDKIDYMTKMNYLSTENILLCEEDTWQYIEFRISDMEKMGVSRYEVLSTLLNDDDWIGEMKDKIKILNRLLGNYNNFL